MLSLDDVFDRGFRLAYYVHQDRAIAIAITIEAADARRIQARKDKKRRWARKAKSTKAVVALTLGDLASFQDLVLSESGHYEVGGKKCERSSWSEEDLAVQYVSRLVGLCSRRRALYFLIGISRMLHSYAIEDAKKLYTAVWPTNRRDFADDCRTIKSTLFRALLDRFDGYLTTIMIEQNERRFLADDPAKWKDIVQRCLELLTPWGTKCGPVIPSYFRRVQRWLTPERQEKEELTRVHTLVHPPCFDKLARVLNLSDPGHELEIPVFHCSTPGDEPPTNRLGPLPRLSDQELREINAELQKRSERRRSITPRVLQFSVDGRQSVQYDITSASEAIITLTEGDRRIDVIDLDSGLPFGVHLIEYDDDGIAAGTWRIDWGAEQAVVFRVERVLHTNQATLQVIYEPVRALHERERVWPPLPAHLIVASLIIGVAAGLWLVVFRQPTAIFTVMVSSEPSGVRGPSGAEGVISIPRGERSVLFEIHPRHGYSGPYDVNLSINHTPVQHAEIRLTQSGVLLFEVSASKLETGTYSIQLIPKGSSVGTPGELFRFELIAEH